MKKLLLIIACVLSFTTLFAQNSTKYYVYGIDFSHAKVFAAEESVEQFSNAFQAINLLLVTEAEKYDFYELIGRRPKVVIDPMMKLLADCDYADLKTYEKDFPEIDYAACVNNYQLPQTEGVGVIMIAKLLDKPLACAYYTLIKFDIATREIISQDDVLGKARGFGLRNYWAGSVYQVIKSGK